jgi:hypothetical protein
MPRGKSGVELQLSRQDDTPGHDDDGQAAEQQGDRHEGQGRKGLGVPQQRLRRDVKNQLVALTLQQDGRAGRCLVAVQRVGVGQLGRCVEAFRWGAEHRAIGRQRHSEMSGQLGGQRRQPGTRVAVGEEQWLDTLARRLDHRTRFVRLAGVPILPDGRARAKPQLIAPRNRCQ